MHILTPTYNDITDLTSRVAHQPSHTVRIGEEESLKSVGMITEAIAGQMPLSTGAFMAVQLVITNPDLLPSALFAPEVFRKFMGGLKAASTKQNVYVEFAAMLKVLYGLTTEELDLIDIKSTVSKWLQESIQGRNGVDDTAINAAIPWAFYMQIIFPDSKIGDLFAASQVDRICADIHAMDRKTTQLNFLAYLRMIWPERFAEFNLSALGLMDFAEIAASGRRTSDALGDIAYAYRLVHAAKFAAAQRGIILEDSLPSSVDPIQSLPSLIQFT